jgi:putative transposase
MGMMSSFIEERPQPISETKLHAMPKRRMYKSYRGTVGKIADNLLNQNFTTSRPYQKLRIDIT